MRKNILYCFDKQAAALDAIRRAECHAGEKKRLTCMRIDGAEGAYFFRVVHTPKQARQLAGIPFAEVYFSGKEPPEAVDFLKTLIRQPIPA